MNGEVKSENLSHEEVIFYAWQRNFNQKKWTRIFLCIVIGGGLIAIASIIYTMMAVDLGETTKADMLAYALGAMSIVAVGMSILGFYTILLSESALIAALKIAKEGFSNNANDMASETSK